MKKKDISVVIIEYYSLDEIDRCIESILASCSKLNFEIIISSNSLYSEEKQEEICLKYPSILWSFNEKNGGFAYGMNEGLKLASGKYLAISNPDIQILKGLDSLISFMDSHPEIGAAAPQILDEDKRIQDSCRPYISVSDFVYRQLRRILLKEEIVLNKKMDYSKTQTVDWVIGAFILVSRAAYEATHGFDDNFFMYVEDLDWCTRIRKSGFEIVYFPQMQIEYKGSRSARKSKKYAKIYLDSQKRFWKKFGYFTGYPKRRKIVFD